MAVESVTHHTIAIQQVEQTLLGARRHGRAVGPLLARAGIAEALIGVPQARVTQAQYARLLRVLRQALRDELWGLCRHPLPLGSFAQGNRLLVGCRTLGDAMALGLRHHRLLLRDFVPRLRVVGGEAALILAARPGAAATPADAAALSYAQRAFAFLAYGLACWLVARRLPLLGVDYTPDALGAASDAPTLFQVPVRYGDHGTGWRFDARWLALPVVQTPDTLRAFMADAPAGLLVRYRDPSSITERMRRLLRRYLAQAEPPSLEQVADELAMAPQTLRRRLQAEGRSFRTLKDELRRDAAIEYLARPDLALPEIAALLGFSEASTFHRAFKHWTGVAPGEYRQTRLR